MNNQSAARRSNRSPGWMRWEPKYVSLTAALPTACMYGERIPSNARSRAGLEVSRATISRRCAPFRDAIEHYEAVYEG